MTKLLFIAFTVMYVLSSGHGSLLSFLPSLCTIWSCTGFTSLFTFPYSLLSSHILPPYTHICILAPDNFTSFSSCFLPLFYCIFASISLPSSPVASSLSFLLVSNYFNQISSPLLFPSSPFLLVFTCIPAFFYTPSHFLLSPKLIPDILLPNHWFWGSSYMHERMKTGSRSMYLFLSFMQVNMNMNMNFSNMRSVCTCTHMNVEKGEVLSLVVDGKIYEVGTFSVCCLHSV